MRPVQAGETRRPSFDHDHPFLEPPLKSSMLFGPKQNGNIRIMGFLWGVVRTVFVFFAVIIAALVVVDASLLSNLLGKREPPGQERLSGS